MLMLILKLTCSFALALEARNADATDRLRSGHKGDEANVVAQRDMWRCLMCWSVTGRSARFACLQLKHAVMGVFHTAWGPLREGVHQIRDLRPKTTAAPGLQVAKHSGTYPVPLLI